MRSPHSKDQLEGSGPAVPAGGDGNAFVIVVRNDAKVQVLCPKCLNYVQYSQLRPAGRIWACCSCCWGWGWCCNFITNVAKAQVLTLNV
jgi:hypothetical protein